MNTPLKVLNFSMEAYSSAHTRDSILKVMDYYFKDKQFDRNFLKKILLCVHEFETRNEEHINFLGSNLLGINKITYLRSDEEKWIDEIIDLAEWGTMEDEIHDLDTVDKSFHVAGSVLNMSYVYVAHRLLTTNSLSKDDQNKGALACFKLFHYKFLASLLNHNFPFKSQESVALALYESLSRKSLLKRYHTWGKVIEARSLDSFSTESIHRKTLLEMNDDYKILYVITDTQSRIREVIKKLYRDYMKLKDEDSRIVSESKYITVDGEKTMKSYENRTESLIRDTLTVIKDKRDFIRNDLVEQTLKLVETADKRFLVAVLEKLVEVSEKKEGNNIPQMVESIIVHIQEYRKTAPKGEDNLISIVVKLRNMYRSSQLTNPDILYARGVMADIVDLALPRKSQGVISAARISAMLYLTLRILTYNHYK